MKHVVAVGGIEPHHSSWQCKKSYRYWCHGPLAPLQMGDSVTSTLLTRHGSMRLRSLHQIQFHRCGPGGSMRACHAAGPGSIPGKDKFPGWGLFSGFSSPVRQTSGSFGAPRPPYLIWPSLSSSIIIHYERQWPEMLTRPKTSNIHTYQIERSTASNSV